MANPNAFYAPPGQLGDPSPLLADNIDPVTKDFRSLFVGADPIDDQVQIAVTTNLGSGAAVQDTGIRLTRRKMTNDIARSLEADARQALRRLIVNRDISFQRVSIGVDDGSGQPTGEVDEANQTVQLNVEFKNLRALDPTTRRVQLKSTPNIQVV